MTSQPAPVRSTVVEGTVLGQGAGRLPSGLGVERRSATEEEARAMASATRLRILRLCLDQPLTNKQIAQQMGRDPASVLYHVRRLVQTGFLVAEGERRGTRGAREVPYRATGKSWVLDIVDPQQRRAGSEAVFEAFVEEVRSVGVDEVSMTRVGLRLTESERDELSGRLLALLEEYHRRRPSSDGEPWSLFIAAHRDPRPVGPPGADLAG